MELSKNMSGVMRPTIIALVVAQAINIQTAQAAIIETGTNCTLAQAITSANTDAVVPGSACIAGSGEDQINLNSDVLLESIAGQFTGLPSILSAVTLNGNDHAIQRADHAPAFRILRIATDDDVILNNITIGNGLLELENQDGAGIFVKTVNTLTLNNVKLLENVAGNNGGGLFIKQALNSEGVSITDSVISSNMALGISNRTDSGFGGGVAIADQTFDGFSLTIHNSQINDNTASGRGGGISADADDFYGLYHSTSSVSISDSTIEDNAAASGAGIYTTKDTLIQRSAISENNASDNGGGIAIQSHFRRGSSAARRLEVEDSSLTSNNAKRGGAISAFSDDTGSSGEVLVENSTLLNNSASDQGGAIRAYHSSLSISNSTLSANLTAGNGGAVATSFNGLNVQGSTLSGNDARMSGGAVYGLNMVRGGIRLIDSEISNNIAGENGGGLSVEGGDVEVVASLIEGNSAQVSGGAIAGSEFIYDDLLGSTRLKTVELGISNSTLSGNSASVQGGAIDVVKLPNYDYLRGTTFNIPELSVVNSTLSNNSASQGGGIASDLVELELMNTIVAGNLAMTASDVYRSPDVTSPATSSNNLFGSADVSTDQSLVHFISSGTDITATLDGSNPALINAILGPLQDNGGNTLTHALPSDSLAVGTADVAVCSDTLVNGVDQRGEVRGDNQCDIGAFELGAVDSLGFTASVTDAVEGEDRFVILTVTLDHAQGTPVNIDFATQDGTAIADSDYVGRMNSIYFQPGQVSKRRWFEVLDDNEIESDESFIIRLNSATDVANSTQVTAEIKDNDAPFTVEITSNIEGRNLIATVNLKEALDTDYKVNFFTMDGTAVGGLDYISRSNVINFKAGETSKRRWFQLLPDNLVEGDETFEIRFSPVDDPSIETVTTATIKDAN